MKCVFAFALLFQALASADTKDLSCQNPDQLTKAKTLASLMRHSARTEGLPGVKRLDAADCGAYWAPEILGRAHPSDTPAPRCGVKIAFESLDAAKNYAEKHGGRAKLDRETFYICGEIVK